RACCPFSLSSGLEPTREIRSAATPLHHALTEADCCRRTAGDSIGREDQAASARNRYGSLDGRSSSAAFGLATESATERALLLRTSSLSRKDDARPGCRRGRSCARQSCHSLGRIVPNNQESPRRFDRPS